MPPELFTDTGKLTVNALVIITPVVVPPPAVVLLTLIECVALSSQQAEKRLSRRVLLAPAPREYIAMLSEND